MSKKVTLSLPDRFYRKYKKMRDEGVNISGVLAKAIEGYGQGKRSDFYLAKLQAIKNIVDGVTAQKE